MNTPAARPAPYAHAMAIAAITLFSAKPIFIKWAFAHGIDASQLMMLRLLMAAPLFALAGLWVVRNHRSTLRDVGIAAGLGVLGSYISGLLDMTGLMYINAQLERMLLFTYPIFTVLLSWVIYKRRPSRAIYLCIVMTYAGLALMFSNDLSQQGEGVITGTLLVLASALLFALYMVLSRAPIQRMGAIPFTAVAMLSSTLVMGVHQGLLAPGQLSLAHLTGYSPEVYGLTAGLAVFCTFIPALLGSEAVRQLGPEQVSLLGNGGPVITTALAVLLLNETFTPWHAAGMGMILAGLWLLQHPPAALIAARS
ncbi:DMT family transporter [Simiduia sp. 21SJ11W-1]|uniref:DMT family transporter n=1 Tax=Simiduia sp. 21SJ11W-1 TaxID=2909669 RepID=UPI00209ED02E|nr:DMT family transporter [Simiduia sp. 21SJ11W-1]UTA47007.1 DMT family transporter [Simiduia sp. 21SJ11W-1]